MDQLKQADSGAPYLRYVDDFVLFHDDPAMLAQWRGRITGLLEGRRLRDRWCAGTMTPEEVQAEVGAWIAHAENADTGGCAVLFREGWFWGAAGDDNMMFDVDSS